MARKAIESGKDDDAMNTMEFLILLETRCNYFTTLEGVVLSHMIRNRLQTVAHIGRELGWVWTGLELIFNMFDDAFVLAMVLLSLQAHWDIFNVGLAMGKIAKICVQYYLEGFMFQDYNDFDEESSESSLL